MTAAENKAAARRMLEEVWSEGRFETADELLAPDFVAHVMGQPAPIRGPEAFKEFVSSFRAGFPDLRMKIEDQVAEGTKIVTRWSARGTHTGDLMGIPPTGNEVRFAGIVIARFQGGKLKESWGILDALGMLQQIGVAPPIGARA